MSTATTVPVIKTMPQISVETYNNPNAIIRMRIISMDIAKRLAVIQVALILGKEILEAFTLEKVTVTKHTIQWLTKNTLVRTEGEDPDKPRYLSGYRKFLERKKFPIETPLNALQFECINGNEDYYANPFRITISREYDSATLQLVNMPGLTKKIYQDPISGESKSVWYYKKHRETGQILTLNKVNYRRIQVR